MTGEPADRSPELDAEPAEPAESGEPREQPPPALVVSSRDELGRAIERVPVADPEAASHWDERLWHRE